MGTMHCPACAATLPEIELQEIVTCEFCGTDVNAEARPEPREAERSPPLTGAGSQRGAPEDWSVDPFVNHLLANPDPDHRLEVSRAGNRELGRSRARIWLPALFEAIDDAERAGNRELRDELARWPEKQIGPGNRHEVNRIVLPWLEARCEAFPGSRVNLRLASALRIAGFALVVRIATAARERDREGRGELKRALEIMARVWVDIGVNDAAVLLDMHTWLIPDARGAVRDRLVESLADLVDSHVQADDGGSPERWEGPWDFTKAVFRWLDELGFTDVTLMRAVFRRIVTLHCGDMWHHRGRELDRWVEPIKELRSPATRAEAIASMHAVFGPPGTSDVNSPPDLAATLPPLEGAPAEPDQHAWAVDGQAPCPSCSQPLSLAPDRIIVTCSSCGVTSKVAREARRIRRRAHEGREAALAQQSPERLLERLRKTEERELRKAILDELSAPTTNPLHHAKVLPDLVGDVLTAKRERTAKEITGALEAIARHGNDDILDGIFAALRLHGFDGEHVEILLRALRGVGLGAVRRLLALTADIGIATPEATGLCRTCVYLAFQELDAEAASGDDRHLAAIEAVLQGFDRPEPNVRLDIAEQLGSLIFRDGPMTPAQRSTLEFVDRHTDPANVTLDGLAMPDWSPAAGAQDAAERAMGLSSYDDAWMAGRQEEYDARLYNAAPGGLSCEEIHRIVRPAFQMGGPEDEADLVARLECLNALQHPSSMVLVLHALTGRLPPHGESTARLLAEVIARCARAIPDLAPTIEAMQA